ncbi:hypothetical protein ACQKQA_14450 [Pseudomonas sp. NPDC089530]|uniref:hypothetical protein n=1 Tax=Pseudomonas sp. NPDC089530 TaxID=3390651 RepID=UPI003D071F11
MKIRKMVQPFTILTHLTGSKYKQDFLREISRLKEACGPYESLQKVGVHQIES